MSSQYETVLNETIKLSMEDWQILVKRLELSVLGLSEKEIEDAWVKIAEERIREYETGKIIAYDVKETIHRLRNQLKWISTLFLPPNWIPQIYAIFFLVSL